MKTPNSPRVLALIPTIVFVFAAAFSMSMAAPPDLTSGGVPNESPPITFNLGPTGARGWVYHVKVDSSESRQILVTDVDSGSPAAGILAVDDVILGADGTGANPGNFSSDARKSLAFAIADAEARNPATLKLLRWRSGSTSTVTLTLQNLGAYSATAPYSCPKSTAILSNGLSYVYNNEDAGRYNFGGLTMLATGDPTYESKAQAAAHAMIPDQATLDQLQSDERDASGQVTWSRGHTLLFLAEYYLATGDALVLPAIEAYALNVAKNQSLFGTVGHIYADKWPDGSPNGPMGGFYGAVNSAGMPCFLGVLLAKECGLTNPELDPAIEASSRFFAYYTGKGAIPYGEGEPYIAHESNGKSGLGALYFHLQANRVEEGKFFAKMATASASVREVGHTGSWFNYLWAPLGAAAGGEEAVAAYFSRVSWMFDLNRRWDGSFVYDCLYGEGPNSGASYHDFKMSTAALLTYALPHRKLRITGKGHDAARYLSSADVAEAVAADDYDPDPRSDSQLISDLANWSPVVRKQAAVELSTRSISSTELSQITAMANDTGAESGSRAGACLALGEIGDSSSAATLAALLSDADNYVRFSSAEAMRYLPTSASLAQVDTILAAAASTGAPLYPMVEEDPLQFAHGRVAILLFYSGNAYGPKGIIWGSGVNGIDRGLLYPAIEAIAKTPIGFSRSTLGATYDYLTEADVLALSGTIVDSITDRAPADRMFSNGVRSNGVEALQRFDIAEGVPACMIFAADEGGGRRNEPLTLLGTFGGGAKDVDPDPDVIAFLETFLSDNETVDAAQASIDAINGDSNPTPLDPLKAIVSVTADDSTVTLPATSTTLRVTATDHAQGDSVFSWRKLSGAGTVSFEHNGTAAAATNTLTFTDGGVGTYEFEVTMSDSRGLTEVYDTVTVTLAAGSGSDTTAPTPNPMTWASAPSAVGNDSVTMTATTASDGSGVEYYFTCTSGPGNNSGWQDSPTYTDIGLAPGTQYTYTVMARDKSANQNATAASGAASATTGGTAPPLKIYILAGQSNMEGHGEMEPIETQGTLQYQVENDPSAFAHLKEGGGWASRGDTWIWYKRNGTDVLNGDLSAGYGRYDHTIGPELQFGIEMGNAHGEQVLLIKTAWGGKSLYTDFRPPSSGWSVNPPVAAGDQGFYYQEMLSYVNDVLTNLSTYFPNYNSAAGYELAGFGWHQGWNDRIDADAVNEYEANLENLINDVRSDLGVPGLPFVIANTGMGGWAETGRPVDLMNAQLAMADPVAYPAFAGNVAVVDTRDFWRDPANSPSQTQSYHWNRNAETYFLIGQSMALGLQSLGAGADTDPPNPNPASFAVAPHAPNDVSVTMTASAGSDISGPVEYLFTETSGNTGGTSSGWQTSATYTDTELLPETTYTYTVTLRDSLGNVGVASAEASASTVSYLDVFPPTPNPAGFAVTPTAASATSIGMVAEEGFDESGPVEYLFTETSGNPGGDSSGWQLSPSYTDTGLTEGVQYTYTVTLRDALGNVGAPSQAFTAAALGSAGQLGVLDLSTTNGGINPVTGQPWAVGDTYRIAFVTDGTRDATSPDIADYDAFAQAQAAAAGWGGGTWRAVVQTYNDPDAKVNTGTSGSGGVGIFLPNGVKIADDNADLWNGSIDNPWTVTETGGTYVGEMPSGSNRKLGDPGESNCEAGNSTYTDGRWWHVYNGAMTKQWHFYVLSDPLTVQAAGADNEPPTPNPASFAVAPAADDSSSISMTATTGIDLSGPVEYFFTETSGNPGGSNSGWQTSPTYTDTGLNETTQYTYTVMMRDALSNAGSASSPASATTPSGPDLVAPNPDPMTWAVVPAAGESGTLVVHEPFDYSSGGDLTNNGGTGFGGAWTTTKNSGNAGSFLTGSSGLSFTDGLSNVLPVSGNSATRTTANGRSEANRILSAASRSALLADGTTIWFSVLHERNNNIEHCGFIFGTGTFNVASGWQLDGYTSGGEGFGFGSSNNEWIEIVGYDNAAGISKSATSLNATSTRLMVGKIEWNANGTNDTFSLYNVTDLTTEPTSPIATMSLDLDQANFDRVTLLSNKASATYDEIRFGSSFDVVVGGTGGGGSSDDSIAMTATTASDVSGVEYYFTETSGNPGGDDSGWQDSPSYTDTGLQSGTQYTYTVMARDKSPSQNTTAASVAASATTTGTPPADTTPPTPDPAFFASAPSATSDTAIVMTATVGSDPSGPVEYLFTETSGNPGGASSGWQASTTYTNSGLSPSTQYTYTVTMRDALGNTGSPSVGLSATTLAAPDTSPPTPNPASFASAPSADSDTAISMTATTGSDPSGPVEYLFTETSGNPGGASSGWQTSPSYTNSGLSASTQYTYTVTMRDSLGNVGNASTASSATTQAGPDTAPPTPNPASFAVVPTADSDTAISMLAVTGSDPSGPVEYFFAETSGNPGGSSSGWQSSPSYTDDGLDAETQYTYTVTMRDALGNTGNASTGVSAMTSAAEPTNTLQIAEVFGHNEKDNYGGNIGDLTNGSGMNGNDSSGVAGWPSGEDDPSTWTATSNHYQAEWQSQALIGSGSNGKVGWAILDLGSETSNLDELHLWNIRENNGRYTKTFNVYLASSPTATVGHGPTDNTAIDYDFSSGGWTLVNTGGVLNGAFQGNQVVALGDASARYVGIEILSNNGDANRVGLAEVAVTTSGGGSSVTVPDVVGLAQATAESNITGAGLAVGTVSTASSSSVPAGDVISQNPTGGSSVASGSAVDLVVSTGPPLVTVPDVVGQAQATAESNITGAGLTVGTVSTASSSSVPAGDVISQNPTGGSSVASGSAVDLVVSTGPPLVSVPDVVGLAQASAESNITGAGLTVGTVTTASSETVPAGDVISQNPTGGSSVASGSAVDLVVSTGPAMVTVPDVVGLSQAAAESAIVAAGLTVGSISTAYSETVPVDDVISQGLTAGSSVPPASAVDLVVSLGVDASPKLVRTTVSAVSNTSWTTVSLGQTYNSAVIIATPIYTNNTDASVVTRITNVTSTSFDLKLDRADALTDPVSMDVSVIAVDEGVYTQAVHGVTMEAVKFTSTVTGGKSNWLTTARSYQNSYTNPVVVGQVMSANGADWSVFWSTGPSRQDPADASNLNIGKHVAEDPNTTRADETIGYIVIEQGSGSINGVAYEAALGADTVRGLNDSVTPYTYSLTGGLSSASAAAVSISAMDGNNGAWGVLAGSPAVSATSIGMYAVEDQVADSERAHTTTQMSYIVFE